MIAPTALDCPCSATLAPLVLASGIPATCATCDAEYLPPPPSASPAPVRAAERPRPAPTPEATPERPQRPASAPRDLDALARVLPVLTGSASPLVRIPGGQSEGSPAERVQGLLEAALRGQRRLAGMRHAGHLPQVLCLLATYVYAGAERRRPGSWERTVELALEPGRAAVVLATPRPGTGPDAQAARVEGGALLASAEALYAEAEELPTDGRWLEEDLDAVSRALAQFAASQRAVARGKVRSKAREIALPRVCAMEASPEDVCEARERGGRLFGRSGLPERCERRRVPGSCARTELWAVRESRIVAALLPAPRRRRRERGPSKKWKLLVAAAEAR